jgi:hypothetical protein
LFFAHQNVMRGRLLLPIIMIFYIGRFDLSCLGNKQNCWNHILLG